MYIYWSVMLRHWNIDPGESNGAVICTVFVRSRGELYLSLVLYIIILLSVSSYPAGC
jgi:hypothetical protein